MGSLRPNTIAFRLSNGQLVGLGAGASSVVPSLPGTVIGTSLSETGAAGAAAGAVGGAVGTALSIGIPVAGAVLGVILGGLLSGHYARERGATNENAALTQIFPAIQSDIVTVIQAFNSGQLDASDAITAINQIGSNYQQAMAQYETEPGTHNGGCTAGPPAVPAPKVTPTPCNTGCTAGCCIYCNVIASWLAQATAAIQAGKGTIQFGSGGASKYGFPAWSYPSLQVKAPAAASATTSSASPTAAGASSPSSGGNLISSLFSPPTGGGFSLGDWLLVGAGVFVLSRIF
jgi:hypothetical protein